eukprot:507289-Amorphochlora_amoeboformis.AAC.1
MLLALIRQMLLSRAKESKGTDESSKTTPCSITNTNVSPSSSHRPLMGLDFGQCSSQQRREAMTSEWKCNWASSYGDFRL